MGSEDLLLDLLKQHPIHYRVVSPNTLNAFSTFPNQSNIIQQLRDCIQEGACMHRGKAGREAP